MVGTLFLIDKADWHLPETFGIVLGHEGHGICDDILNLCDQLVHIEMEQFESLNVAVAAAILCYEMRYNK